MNFGIPLDYDLIANWMEFTGDPRQRWLRDRSLPARLHLTFPAREIAGGREAACRTAEMFAGYWWPLWRALRRAADHCPYPTTLAILEARTDPRDVTRRDSIVRSLGHPPIAAVTGWFAPFCPTAWPSPDAVASFGSPRYSHRQQE